ncbi:arylsulfatase [Marvinbryantia formatexigens DSM 14469]|uniref:Arylsulfatase n=1 Tax=Marvinbryantia formatexigens DSM 14469 TaxID=478749 RepID=C6LCU1_9FIRM|nr:LTA synthase family protein [Marvinbryantia formatexigens]EET61755.1 arylsulfatase [Marvinbryantia formatexigens DSM 14469]UWO24435.1 LTA synthase family protein [Marvinbryantia formatexigens DSM 14469]SDF07529.1 Phosphoglycerol transferase MdoB [Marvinbryantia formatexigens]
MKKVFNFKIKAGWANALVLALMPPLTLCCLEFYTHVPWDLTVPIFLLNLLFYYLLFAVCSFVFGSTAVGYAVAPLFPMLFGLINYFVVDFRSSPIVPWDLYSLGTAVSVAGNYSYTISARLVLVVLGFLLIAFLGSRTSVRLRKPVVRIAGAAALVLSIAVWVQAIGTDTAVSVFGLDTTLFTPNVLYRNNGLTVGFLGNLKYMKVQKPEGYTAQRAEEIAAPYKEDGQDASGAQTEPEDEASAAQTGTLAAQETADMPNVIVIMNEAFSDLSVFGDFETDYDYMPFIHSLEENVIKGNCYVSVKGGNTANSEYEFLTGDSMAFLPAGSVPYQQYIKKDMPSLASYLGSLGYRTTAIHPYNASGWDRDDVYPRLGFDNMLFKNDFSNPLLIRNYVSDNSAFTKIIELYEEKQADEPMFVFEVTMQNHGGYSKDVEGFEESVHLTDLENKTTSVRAAEKYLTLMLESDRAFEMLVNYFAGQEEDTIILMFGDHQPSDYVTNTILRLLGLEREGSDEVYFNNYIVPYIMWANFDLDGETEGEDTSLNYLGGMLLEKAGLPLTGYQKYLQELQVTVPVITANMIMTEDGVRYRYDDGEELVSSLLEDYHMLMYNHLADSTNLVSGFFD